LEGVKPAISPKIPRRSREKGVARRERSSVASSRVERRGEGIFPVAQKTERFLEERLVFRVKRIAAFRLRSEKEERAPEGRRETQRKKKGRYPELRKSRHITRKN